jgi:phosphoribosyl 1,2-cyclic phosphate phosphodiesterase
VTARSARVTFLGTGTSHGVPMIGCRCATCCSTDPRDKRWRPSIYIELPDGTRVLVDTSTDLRAQALAFDVPRIDAILFTHEHADHVFGLDEVRRFNHLQHTAIPCYAPRRTAAALRRTFAYVFGEAVTKGGGIPQLDLYTLSGGPFSIGGETIVPVPILHGTAPILGYRLGPFAYLTDCSAIPDSSWPLLDGVKLLVLDALRHRPHPTHFSVSEALEAIERIAPERALLTHMCHDLPHAETCAALPAGVELAYDGLRVTVDLVDASNP